ncbi:hypothetical protein G7054_g12718 [Neopestalotiopsis clavispora]|nr:hypothetical protein G7054_g12718 [Neopestalotiopsis clavispora]
MSNDRDSSPPSGSRERRGSVTSAAFSSLFQRSNSISTGSNGNQMSSAAAARDPRRRLSVTTLGLSGGGPAPPASATGGAFGGIRRGSISTNNSDSIDENAIEDDENSTRTAPTTPFVRPVGRRVSAAQASTALPQRSPSDILSATRADQGFNWSEQLRSRAESSVSGIRPSFSMASGGGSPPRPGNGFHDRAKSVSDMPAPPQQAAAVKPKQPEPRRPDAMQERILKGDFYMD